MATEQIGIAIALIGRDNADFLRCGQPFGWPRRASSERALALGGTITGEHGVGIGKLDLMAAEHGAGWAVMGAIKTALDPQGILNPGKLVPPKN